MPHGQVLFHHCTIGQAIREVDDQPRKYRGCDFTQRPARRGQAVMAFQCNAAFFPSLSGPPPLQRGCAAAHKSQTRNTTETSKSTLSTSTSGAQVFARTSAGGAAHGVYALAPALQWACGTPCAELGHFDECFLWRVAVDARQVAAVVKASVLGPDTPNAARQIRPMNRSRGAVCHEDAGPACSGRPCSRTARPRPP